MDSWLEIEMNFSVSRQYQKRIPSNWAFCSHRQECTNFSQSHCFFMLYSVLLVMTDLSNLVEGSGVNKQRGGRKFSRN